MQQLGLLPPPQPRSDWALPELPILTGVDTVSLDGETSGLNPWKHKLIGLSVSYRAPDLRSVYLPFGHAEGNFDPDVVKHWAENELFGKTVIFQNAKFDIQFCKSGGLDLEAMSIKPRDVSHGDALLDDSRETKRNLDALAERYTGERKADLLGGKKNMDQTASWEVAAYAMQDSRVTYLIDEAERPLITAQNLDSVLQLENDLIFPVCEIERNGARLDVPKLERWREEVRRERDALELLIWQTYKMRVNPNSGDDVAKLLRSVGVTVRTVTAKGKTSITGKTLKGCHHPAADMVLRFRQIDALLNNYLDKLWRGLSGPNHDLVRFQLHQLKGGDEEDDKKFGAGTISGRFSSTGGGKDDDGYGFNVQQVFSIKNQRKALGPSHIIRELFIPDEGFDYWSADAKQIEYRIFGHYTESPSILAAYAADEDADFHGVTQSLLKSRVPGWSTRPDDETRGQTKIVSFARLYGAGTLKIAFQLGLDGVTEERYQELYRRNLKARAQEKQIREGKLVNPADRLKPVDPETELPQTFELLQVYDAIMPEAKDLRKEATYLAKTRGYIRTIGGRRARFPDGQMTHSAVNRLCQGSAADIFKKKLLTLYNERETLGIHKLRQPVHDEQCGDLTPDPVYQFRLDDAFRQQEIDLKVPILWDLHIGSTWAACK
jgi:DNA polymerase I-like protein with 3'-5' exonuclease and polymerase domains